MKKVGIIGSGVVGRALAKGFIKNGYLVMMGSRIPEKLNQWVLESGESAFAGNFEETAAYGDLLVLAVKGTAALEALELCKVEDLKNKTIIDATNPIADNPPQDGVLSFFTDKDESLMERLQATFPDANFVKAFNSVGNIYMVDPPFEIKPTMFICGNNNYAKQAVTEVLKQFGWETEDLGLAIAARPIEQLCILYCIPGFRENRWNHAFKFLKA